MSSAALAPLQNRDFRYLLSGFAIGQMLMPLQFITQILWVQQFAPRDIWLILVAAIAASRGLGALTFSMYGGALADRFNRRKLLLAIQSIQVVCTLSIAALMYVATDQLLGYAAFFALTFLASGLQSIDGPTRLAIVPDVLGTKDTPAGMSLNQIAAQVAMPIAMAATGILITGFGYSGAYLISVVGILLSMAFIFLMGYVPDASQQLLQGKRYGAGEAISDIAAGLRWVTGHHVIAWLIILVVLMMSFGYPAIASFGPTWVTTVIEVPIAKMGFVVMFWGIGSLAGAIVMAKLSSFEQRGHLIAFGTLLFSISFLVFVSGHSVWNAIVGNIGLGAGMTITMVSSTILIQHLTPNNMRGRVMSLFQLNMAFAQLMTMPVAILAQVFSLQTLFPVLAWITLTMVILVLVLKKQVVRVAIPQPK
jgi:predicted MFS family arabinose efflux permease